MKTKTVIVLGLMVVLVVGCVLSPKVKSHRPAYYENEKMGVDQMAAGVVGSLGLGGFGGFAAAAGENYRREQKARTVYPECQGMTETTLWQCVREIDIKEGRITEDYVEPERPNMDRVMEGGQ